MYIPSVSSAKRVDRLWGTTQPAIQWVPVALSVEVNRPGLDANHSASFSASVKKMWSCISTPRVYPNGVYSDYFSFLPQYDFLQINQPTRCNSFTSLLLDFYVWLNMFRAPLRPSSGAYNCTRSLWFYLWSVGVGALLVVV